MGLQYAPIKGKSSFFAEPVDYRQDKRCGPGILNSLGTQATCSDPYSEKNCCFGGTCTNKTNCECDGCVESEKLNIQSQLINQYSLHVGIVSLYPLMFG